MVVERNRHDHGLGMNGRRSNGLAFSCGERAVDHLQKTNDLAREAVSCNAGLDALREVFDVRSSGVMVAGLEKVDSLGLYQIDQTMLLATTP